MTFGAKLYALRKKTGMSQEDLGQKLKVSRQTIFKWETDAACPEYKKIKEICITFGVSADYLIFEGNGEEQNGQEVLSDNDGQAEQCESVAVLCDCNQDDSVRLVEESEVACCSDCGQAAFEVSEVCDEQCAQVDTTDIAQTEQDDKTKAKAKFRKIAKTICKIYNYFAWLVVAAMALFGIFLLSCLAYEKESGIVRARTITTGEDIGTLFIIGIAFLVCLFVWLIINFIERRIKNGENS